MYYDSENLENILHIFNDDKFVDRSILLFENIYPEKSIYYVIVRNQDMTFQYVNSSKVIPISLTNESSCKELAQVINRSKSKIIFLHALNEIKQKLIGFVDETIVKVWFVWGYDLYNEWKPLERKIYEKETLAYLDKGLSRKEKLVNLLFYKYYLYKVYKKSLRTFNSQYFKAVQKMDVVVPVLPLEMQYVQKLNKNLIYAPFTYGYLEDILKHTMNENVMDSKNILVGNSGNPSNNHIDAFKVLSKLNLENRKVIVPLSYGGSKKYIDFVIEKGRDLLGDNFQEVLNFMSLDDFNRLILSCGHVVFNHIRQQAVSNILTMGYAGAKFYFNEKSVGYKYYKSLGFNLNGLNELDNVALNSNLSAQEYIENRKILEELYSFESVKLKTIELFKTVNRISVLKTTKNNYSSVN
ncbi:MAG: TDP-N-acetylfucosamine:lipid II N-acetylfucosaminyltransferase [Jejuia sp.]